MASSFRNYKKTGITGETTVFTGAASTETTLIGCTIANTSANDAAVDVKIGGAYMLKGAPVFTGGAMTPIGGEQKVVMMAGEDLKVTSTETVDVIVSVLEKV